MSADGPRLEEVLASVAALLRAWPHGGAIIGGIAMVARVRPRFTLDVDLVLVVPAGEVRALLALAHDHGWIDEPAETATLLEGGLLRLFRAAPRDEDPRLDVLFVDGEFLAEVVRRATPLDLGVATLPVATVEDLLLLKLEAHRPQDIDDLLAIKDGCGARLDWRYVRARAAALGLTERLSLYFDPAPPA